VRRLAPFLGALALALGAAATASAHPSATDCSRGYYKNVSGHCIHSPSSSPAGATARCWDGTYSYSEHASGTCSHHGGVRIWIHHP
jgi:Protein of unknown function (DUF3761)